MAIQLDVRDILDVAVRGEDTLLILASEEGDLDLLALILVRVVLHRAESSRSLRRVACRVWELEDDAVA